MQEILSRTKGILPVPSKICQRKAALVAFITERAPQDLLDLLRTLGRQKRQAQQPSDDLQREPRKRKRGQEDGQATWRVAQRLEEEELCTDSMDSALLAEEFMRLPSDAESKACYRAFYDATSNAALEMTICAVCAREVSVQGDLVTCIPLASLPHASRLIPRIQHPAHDLYDGKLLQPDGVITENGVPNVKVCALPEEYGRWSQCGNSAMSNAWQRISSMIQGDLMPRPPAILASVVSVTFIGLGELPKRWLRTTFRVRRHTVHEALRWLKENNTKYYGGIEINPQRIRDLPEDDVPIEIWETICQCTDTGMVP
ncbi:hypothetical protein OBBRIDRAFT_801545 [Obba rivulosa]|uniref:DUF6570 domain-containing protein n=1 Tax=Obba rivulosa TaxID=1052685 RepID=A0A8E2J3J2_9APHY|nr:hypothetical protein OBBRIDRAFT_801545 [Obba rivulosa]